jgi:hypothetical protein
MSAVDQVDVAVPTRRAMEKGLGNLVAEDDPEVSRNDPKALNLVLVIILLDLGKRDGVTRLVGASGTL